MGMYSSEHKEFVMDVGNVIISYTPISGVLATIKFSQKWFSEKKVPHRVARYIHESDRKSFIKTRSRRIMVSRMKATTTNP
jgi:hypothetical protein